MNTLIITLLSLIILILILMWGSATYNRFSDFIIRINEAEANIDMALRKRFDLLNKSIGLIKFNIDKEEDILQDIVKMRSKKLNNFELDRTLYASINEFNNYIEANKELKKVEEILNVKVSLNESEIEIVAARKYFNDVITDYNKAINKFPGNIVKFICRFKKKEYFGSDDETLKL